MKSMSLQENSQHSLWLKNELEKKSREEKDAFVKLQQEALQSDKVASPHNTIYETIISTSSKRLSKWIVAEQFGSFKNRDGRETISEKLPQAAIAALVRLKDESKAHG